jgi:hypothetical protein
MSTKWVVTAAAEQVALDRQRKGETTFTVTNPSGAADRAVFDVVGGDGADTSWFTVEEPQRLVRPGASVSYLLKVAIPGNTPPGKYDVQGLVYSVDSAPEESSVLSPRVKLEVAADPEPVARRRWPWWWLVAAGVGLVLLVVVGVVVFGGGDEEPAAGPAVPTPGPVVAEVMMPDLLGRSEREALQTLADLGLTVRPIKYRHDPERADQVVLQSLEPDTVVDPAAVVDLEVAVELAAPVLTSPEGVPQFEAGELSQTLEWDNGLSPVRRWQVTWSRERCVYHREQIGIFFPTYQSVIDECAFPDSDGLAFADVSSHTLEVSLIAPGPLVNTGAFHTGWVRAWVTPLDDFGVGGPTSEPVYFRMSAR